MTPHKKVTDDTEKIEPRPSAMCKKTFVTRPDFWVVAGLMLAIFSSVFAYAVSYGERVAKIEQRQDNYDQTSREILTVLKTIDAKVNR